MNDVPADPAAVPAKKPPRKPRPSEIAAKKAKAAAKKVAKRKAKAKRKPAKKVKPVKKAKRGNGKPLVRTERLDMRVTKADKRKLEALSKKKGIPVTYVVLQAIAKLR